MESAQSPRFPIGSILIKYSLKSLWTKLSSNSQFDLPLTATVPSLEVIESKPITRSQITFLYFISPTMSFKFIYFKSIFNMYMKLVYFLKPKFYFN